MDNPSSWPSIDDVLCSIEYTHFTYMSDYDITGDHILFYNVPVQMGSDQMNLSLGYVGKYDWNTGGWQFNYKVYGTTQGFDEERGAPNRADTARRMASFIAFCPPPFHSFNTLIVPAAALRSAKSRIGPR